MNAQFLEIHLFKIAYLHNTSALGNMTTDQHKYASAVVPYVLANVKWSCSLYLVWKWEIKFICTGVPRYLALYNIICCIQKSYFFRFEVLSLLISFSTEWKETYQSRSNSYGVFARKICAKTEYTAKTRNSKTPFTNTSTSSSASRFQQHLCIC